MFPHGTRKFDFTYGGTFGNDLAVSSNASYGDNVRDRRSSDGFIFDYSEVPSAGVHKNSLPSRLLPLRQNFLR